MLLQRFSPLFPASQLRDDLDRLLSNAFTHFPDGFNVSGWGRFPALNVWQDEANLFVEAEVPGLSLDELQVFVEGDALIIKHEHKSEHEEGDKTDDTNYITRERVQRTFSRTVQLPLRVDEDKVSATLKDGVLTVTLPKAQEVLPHRIEVKG
ncbi:MAG: Hsp20/alpha crystallin family protein [Planctomycetota bacterium]|jgi:HSP20 family protein